VHGFQKNQDKQDEFNKVDAAVEKIQLDKILAKKAAMGVAPPADLEQLRKRPQ